MKLSKLASAMPFAHFLGLSSDASTAAAEDDERKQRDGESDDDYAKRMEELDDEEAKKAEEERKKEEEARAEEERKREEEARRAEEEADDEEASEEDKKDDREEGKRAGRAKGARQRERIRCARILAAGIKAGRVNQACVFAFDSGLSASAAVSALNAAALDVPKSISAPAAAAPRRPGLGQRMSAVQTPNPGAAAPAAASTDPAKAAADRILAVAERVRGK